MTDKLSPLETKIPPPIVMLALAGLMWVVAHTFTAYAIDLPLTRVLAISLAAAGLWLNLYPKILFKRAGTTANPIRPNATTSLLTTGIYRRTRNPMYLGQALILLAWAFQLRSALCFLAIPAFLLYITRFQIQPEEHVLAARFPQEYASYCARVPRWI